MTGKVYLVGAGPGDPTLLTVKAQQCLKIADVVLHDRLVDARILALTSSHCQIIDVGKSRTTVNSTQDTINSMLVELARSGKQVVRIKGGDPLIFGRGSEEAAALYHSNIAFEIVPGISSIAGVPTYAGIPLTHRGVSSGFTVINGSTEPGNTPVDWPLLAAINHTLVIVMGWQDLKNNVESLIAHGKSPRTPIALIQWGTFPYQKTVIGTLETIFDQAQESGLGPPVITVIGEVVSLRDSLRWFDNRPLTNKRILITRDKAQSRTLSQMLLERGANPIELPTIEFAPPETYRDFDKVLEQLHRYDWIVFTSAHGVQGFFDRMWDSGFDARNLNGIQICCIGDATASRAKEYGIMPDFVPDNYSSEDILKAFSNFEVSGKSILLPRSDIAPLSLPQGLEKIGAKTTELVTYRNVIPEESKDQVAKVFKEPVDIAIFASSSSVINFIKLLDGRTEALSNTYIACIGPVTAKTARENGLSVSLVPKRHTLQGIVESIETLING